MRLSGLVCAAVLAGCGESNDMRIAPYLVDAVQVSKLEPGAACRPLGALDGVSDDDESRYESAYASLRTRAALRGGNYVVIDAVTTEPADRSIIINGRLYACAFGAYSTLPVADR